MAAATLAESAKAQDEMNVVRATEAAGFCACVALDAALYMCRINHMVIQQNKLMHYEEVFVSYVDIHRYDGGQRARTGCQCGFYQDTER